MKDPLCGCCAGTEALTPLPTANRAGLDALRYRVGTHATFVETMVARLTSHRLEDGRRPLQRLTTRAPDDPALALLDAWATVADVLSFYQERIANEGYLRTATERFSILQLARLTGYRLRPGVAASVYLAFRLEDDFETVIPAGTRARSLPGPGEFPQAFETDEPLEARGAWNALRARRTRPSVLHPVTDFEGTREFWVQGVAPALTAGDTVLFVCGNFALPFVVRSVEPDRVARRTRVAYAPYATGELPPPAPSPPAAVGILPLSAANGEMAAVAPSAPSPAIVRLAEAVAALRKRPSLPPATRFEMARSPERTYDVAADLAPQLLVRFDPTLAGTLFAAYAAAPVTGIRPDDLCQVQTLRVTAAPFGHNAPQELVITSGVVSGHREWSLAEFGRTVTGAGAAEAASALLRTIHLDQVYDGITPGSWVVIDRADLTEPLVTRVVQVRTLSRADYGIAARVTQLVLADAWLTGTESSLSVLRGTTVHVASEPLDLAEEPIDDDVAGDTLELDGLYDGLEAGRWLVVSGVRTDVSGVGEADEVETIEASELVMLAGVTHDVQTITGAQGNPIELPTDTLHTRLVLAEPLAYRYRRDSVAVNANVARATHGERREEPVGGGDGSRPFQSFELADRPLTFVGAPTPAGVRSTLEVRVDGVRWAEHPTLLYLGRDDRGYVTRTDDDGTTHVVFGDGRRGLRPVTGAENVTAGYRVGIGRAGNLDGGRISQLATRPLGVKEVINPRRSSGGADPECRDQARRNVPLALLALDRLVSVQDYADFARTFAGIARASAISLSDGARELVHLTVAGVDDAPIEPGDDLHRNLMLALRRFGDPRVRPHLAPREAVFLFLSARVRVLDDHRWEDVEPRLRAALLETFAFDRRELGQDALLSEAIGTAHRVAGVDYVDVDLFDGIAESEALDVATLVARLEAFAVALAPAPGDRPPCAADRRPRARVRARPARVDQDRADSTVADPSSRIRPAQIAYLNPELPDTLVLTELTS